MGDDDVSKLQPPRLFGRGRAPKRPAVQPEERPEPTGTEAPTEAPAPTPAVTTAATPTPTPTPIPEAIPEAKHAKAAPSAEPKPVKSAQPAPSPAQPARPKAAKPKRPKSAKAPKAPKAPRERRRLPRLRRPTGLIPVALVGLLSGAALAGLTWAFLQADPGEHLTFVYVVLVFIVAVAIGWFALRLLGVRSAGTIAFLGTGVVAMVAICIGSGPLDTVGGAIGVIVGSAPAYALSGWITVRFIDAA